LVEEFGVYQAHGFFGETTSEAGDGGMIGRGVVKGESQEFFEGVSVIDLGFQFRIGVDVKPLLKQQAFHKQDRRISFGASGAFADGIGSHEQFFDSGPIDDGINLLHSFDGPVFLHGRHKRDVGEGEIGLHFLEAHSSSKGDFGSNYGTENAICQV